MLGGEWRLQVNIANTSRPLISLKWGRSVRKAHRGLGHLPSDTFLRMLSLGEGSMAALVYAKQWRCLVCLAASRPKRPVQTTARVATIFFYQNDVRGFEVLVGVRGTSTHCAVWYLCCNCVPRGMLGEESCTKACVPVFY